MPRPRETRRYPEPLTVAYDYPAQILAAGPLVVSPLRRWYFGSHTYDSRRTIRMALTESYCWLPPSHTVDSLRTNRMTRTEPYL
jgi:hypothetical protein